MGWLAAGRSIVHGGSSQSKTSMNGARKSRWVSVLIDHTSSLLVPFPSFDRAHVWFFRGKCADLWGPSASAHSSSWSQTRAAGDVRRGVCVNFGRLPETFALTMAVLEPGLLED